MLLAGSRAGVAADKHACVCSEEAETLQERLERALQELQAKQEQEQEEARAAQQVMH